MLHQALDAFSRVAAHLTWLPLARLLCDGRAEA